MNLSQLIIEEYSFRIKNKQQKFVKIKEDETYLKLIQILKCDNHTFKSLILQSPNNQGLFNIQKQKATKNIKAIMRILWQSTLQYLSSQLNSKLTNSKSNSNNQKQKVISFACYNNSNFKDQFQMQEGSQLQIQYNNISRYIWNNIKKQSILFNKNIPVQKTKVQTIKNQKDLEKCIKKWHQYKIDQVYSLINIPFIQMQIQKQQIYEKIKKSTQCRHIIEKLLGNYDNSNYTKKLFLFFKDILKEEQLKSEKKIENHFLIKINCQKMLQETENNQVFEFIKNLVLKTTKHNSLNISQLKENNNNLSKQILIDKQFFKVQNQKTSSTQLQKKNLNLQNNLNCDHSYFSFPQSQITMDIEDFVNNYMYSSQLKVINKKFNTPAKQFKYQIQKQKLILALQKYLQKQQIKIQNFQCTLKSPSTLLISQQTFNNLQIQNLIITKFSKRLINQYRAYQYRNKFLKNLHNFHSRKLSFDKLQHFMITKKRQYFKHFKKRIGAKFLSNCIFNKQKKNFKYFIKKIKFNGISKVLCNTLMKITLNNSIFNKKIAFVKLKKKWKKIQSLKKILETLFKLQQIKDWKKQFLNQIQKPNKLYELTVTSPKGGKTNYHDLSIQINQVNKAVSHPGNTSTSNVKNSLSYGTKGFNKINLFPIEQEQSISSNEDQKKINSQKIQQRQNNQVNNEIKTKNNLNGSKVSDLSNSLVSQKSQIVQYLKKQQLCLIKDYPHFSFQGWYEDAINFKKSPLTQPSKPCQALFKKFESEKSSIIVQSEKQIQEDQTIKQRIAVHSFMNYLRQFVNLKNNTQKVQDIIKVQQKPLKQPILKAYPISSKPTLFSQIFNVILKLGLHKNTSKSFQQLLNLIIKPIKQIYNEEIMKANNLFNDEPLMTNSYTSEYNAIRDQMFLQFIKQIMGNDDIYSVKSLIKSLQIITRYIYPSNIFFYSFISYLKSSQIKRAQLYDPIYRNMLMFAQAAEGNKGTNVKIYKDQTAKRTQIQNSGYLFPRVTQLTKIQTEQVPANIKVKLPNGISFEYNVRNQIFKTIKRRILQKLGFSQYQKNYALYQSRGLNSFIIIQDKTKVIDYLMGERQKQSKKKYNQVYLRIKHYYPIKIRQINHLRMFYLNMITDEGRLPWKLDHYQNIVALSMLFDQFQQQRIGNYLGLAKKLTKNQPDLTKIQAKYSALANQGSKKISQFEYFKRMKQSNFLLAKCYKEQQQKKQYDEQIKIVIKPKQLLFYEGSEIKSSINLFRIKTVFFQNNQISIELIYSKQQRQGTNETQFIGEKRTLLIKGFYKIKELFQDILYYGQLLIK